MKYLKELEDGMKISCNPGWRVVEYIRGMTSDPKYIAALLSTMAVAARKDARALDKQHAEARIKRQVEEDILS